MLVFNSWKGEKFECLNPELIFHFPLVKTLLWLSFFYPGHLDCCICLDVLWGNIPFELGGDNWVWFHLSPSVWVLQRLWALRKVWESCWSMVKRDERSDDVRDGGVSETDFDFCLSIAISEVWQRAQLIHFPSLSAPLTFSRKLLRVLPFHCPHRIWTVIWFLLYLAKS